MFCNFSLCLCSRSLSIFNRFSACSSILALSWTAAPKGSSDDLGLEADDVLGLDVSCFGGIFEPGPGCGGSEDFVRGFTWTLGRSLGPSWKSLGLSLSLSLSRFPNLNLPPSPLPPGPHSSLDLPPDLDVATSTFKLRFLKVAPSAVRAFSREVLSPNSTYP